MILSRNSFSNFPVKSRSALFAACEICVTLCVPLQIAVDAAFVPLVATKHTGRDRTGRFVLHVDERAEWRIRDFCLERAVQQPTAFVRNLCVQLRTFVRHSSGQPASACNL